MLESPRGDPLLLFNGVVWLGMGKGEGERRDEEVEQLVGVIEGWKKFEEREGFEEREEFEKREQFEEKEESGSRMEMVTEEGANLGR